MDYYSHSSATTNTDSSFNSVEFDQLQVQNIEPSVVENHLSKGWQSKFEECGKCQKDLKTDKSYIGSSTEMCDGLMKCVRCPQKFCVDHAMAQTEQAHKKDCDEWREETLQVFDLFGEFSKEMIPRKPCKSILKLYNVQMNANWILMNYKKIRKVYSRL